MITKNVEIFSANKLMFSPAGDGWCKVSPCGDLLLEGKTPDQKSVGRAKPMGAQRPTPFWWGAQTPVAEGTKNLLSLKAANSHLWWSGVALVVFMIVWWLDRLPVISCSNSAAFLTAEQIFLKAWKARAFSFTPTYRGEPQKAQLERTAFQLDNGRVDETCTFLPVHRTGFSNCRTHPNNCKISVMSAAKKDAPPKNAAARETL